MLEEQPEAIVATHDLSSLVIPLLKGVLYRDGDASLWSALLTLQARVRDYVAVLNLELVLDEAEGYAFLRSRPAGDDDGTASSLPRLVPRRPLSFPVSLLLALLRKKLAESDAGGGDTRLILSREQIVELIRVFLPAGSNETKLIDQIETHVNKIVELGFLRRLKPAAGKREGQAAAFEVQRILKAFVDAQWLADFDAQLAAYQAQLGAAAEGKQMTDMQLPGLDFVADDALSGFRLHQLEVFNWGTFDARVWTLNPGGMNALLTGDIGSGKSTLVDAVTTLLVPAHRIAYNKAAGADVKERTLRSYVLGHYKSERNETSGAAKPVALRDHNSYSVILGRFHNAGYDQTVTLAQVFWMKDAHGQPARLFVGAERALSIAADFANFGPDIAGLRKKLRGLGAEMFDSFPPYGAWFRRRFGIENEQALELFHQTVSMKSVGNLTDFVRSHMLEPFDVAPRIAALIGHFDDLNRAHEAVLKAKRQMERLTPLVDDCERHTSLVQQVEALRACREALKYYAADLKHGMLEKRIAGLAAEWERQDAHVRRHEAERDAQRVQESELRRNIAENGGDRIERLDAEIKKADHDCETRKRKAQRYAELVQEVGESSCNHRRSRFPRAAATSCRSRRSSLYGRCPFAERSHRTRCQSSTRQAGT